MPLLNLDHLVYVVTDLESGMDAIEDLFGVRPVHGGQHPDFGTHNALLGLGPTTYLEIVAPVPQATPPARGVWLQEYFTPGGRLVTWALRVPDIQNAATKASAAGLPIGPVMPGSRQKPEGTLLTWQLTDLYAMPMQGLVPFLIDWGDTPHPAGSLPQAGKPSDLQLEHPEPEKVTGALKLLGIDLVATQSRNCRIVASIQTNTGMVSLC